MNEPKLRFPEFTGDWKQHKFEDVVTIGSGKDYKHLESGNVPVYGTGGYMLSVNQALSENEDAVGIGRKGTIDKPYILRAPFWTVDTLFYCIPHKGFDLTFTNCLFQNVDWKKKDESTGVPSLSKVIINDVKAYTPSLEEQQKIASLFTELDSLIQSAEKELEGYRELKQGMLQKMFPKKGETVPEIRFPEFTGDWENHKLSDIAVLTSSKRVHAKDYVETGVPFYRGKEISELKEHKPISEVLYIAEYKYNEISSMYGSPKEGDLLITAVGTLGNTWVIDQTPFYFKDGNLIWFKNIKCNPNYLDYAMSTADGQKKILASAIGSNQKALTIVKLNELEFMFPEKAEQNKIAEYFSYLDNLIISQQQELDGYKELKKGLLQQMFC